MERFEDSSNLDQLRDLQNRLETAEQEIVRRDALLAAIVENAHDAIIARDLSGKIIVWNHAAEELYGWRADEMIGTPIYRIIPREKVSEHDTFIDRVRQGEGTGPVRTKRITKDGKVVEIALSVSPIVARNGEILGASAIEHEDFTNND